VYGENGETSTSFIWASKDLSIKFPKSAAQGSLAAFEGIDGFPVKIEQDINQMGMSFSMTILLNEAKEATVADAEFTVPKDYSVVEGMPDMGKMFGK